jgi:ParB-like chromosome segregation protein Spo0J
MPARRALDVEQVALDKLTPHPDNPRRGNLDAIRESLRHNGWFGTLVAQRSTGLILVGNHRYAAAQAEGMMFVPVHWVDVDDETARRILVADNRTGELAVWDEQALVALLVDLGSLDGTAFSADDLAEMIPMPPADFDVLDETLETEHTCPKCGYRWSGSSTRRHDDDENDE